MRPYRHPHPPLMTEQPSRKQPQRLAALDVLRGLTVAGMILVNNPGSWSYIYRPLDHASWNGMTPTDLVFPFFMFIMGFSAYISLQKYGFHPQRAAFRKIIRRTVGIYLTGLVIGWFAHFCRYWAGADHSLSFGEQLIEAVWSFPTLRLTGVLARLAVCYGIASTLSLCVKHKYLPYIALSLLLVYFIILLLGNGFEYDETNIVSIVDRAVIGTSHLYNDNGIDPEGLLSTLPAAAHVIIGFSVGKMFFTDRSKQATGADVHALSYPTLHLMVVGGVLMFAGLLLQYGCPLNKKIWSPTFVLATCGMASLLLGILLYFIDFRGKGSQPLLNIFRVFGVNPLFCFVISDILAILFGSIRVHDGTTNLIGLCYHALVPVLGNYGGSLIYALLFVTLNWLIAYPLYRHKIYIKL